MTKRFYRGASMAAACFLLAAGAGVAAAQQQGSGADHEFAMKAAQGGEAEVELGKLAVQNGSSPDVKNFGQKMVDDHTKANDQLKSLASQKGITLPTTLDAKDQALKEKLSQMKGAEFDKAYMQHMTADHRHDVSEFEKEARSGKDADLKNFASETLPILQEHKRLAQDVAGKVSASGSGASASGSADRSQEQK